VELNSNKELGGLEAKILFAKLKVVSDEEEGG